jgi:hypothetical protein
MEFLPRIRRLVASAAGGERLVPIYLVEREFPSNFDSFLAGSSMSSILTCNEDSGVTWLCTYITEDGRRTYWLADAVCPEAIRKAARKAGLPAGIIHRISILVPHAYRVGPARM